MDWYYLGHAMWLADLGGVRVLFDPLLGNLHHGGVFSVKPARTIDAAALRPDFVVVSHQHPDHFDVRSLRKLAALDPDTVVLTADPLVEETAARVGFRTVQRLDALHVIDLAGARLLTTTSYGTAREWGVMVATAAGVVWNQVDTYHRGVADVNATLAAAAQAFAATGAPRRLALGLARWQPLLEIAALTGDRIGFPLRDYANLLAQVAALDARAVVPASAGAHHVGPYGWMDRLVYPVPEARFLRDLAARAPGTKGLPGRVGARYRVDAGAVEYDPDGGRMYAAVRPEDERDPRVFRPFEIPPLRDPNLDDRPEGPMRAEVGRWVLDALAPALAAAYPKMQVRAPLRFVVEVVFPQATDAYTITVDAQGAQAAARFDDDYDVLNAVAGSQLCDVIGGRRHWGDVLLGGMLRATSRAYTVAPDGVSPANVGLTFLYYAIPYEESMRRVVAWELDHPGEPE